MKAGEFMTLWEAAEGKEYLIRQVNTEDTELNSFLFSLGCYSGEPITVIFRHKTNCTVSIKDGRYNIDRQLAQAIALVSWDLSAVMIRWSYFCRLVSIG